MIVISMALLLSHLLADFVLQRRVVVQGKGSRRWRSHAEHAVLHLAAAEGALAVFTSIDLGVPTTQGLLLAYVLAHAVLDMLKAEAERRERTAGRWLPFVVDQLAHLGVILALAWILAGAPPAVRKAWQLWQPVSGRVLTIAVVYVGTVCGAGYLNGVLLGRWAQRLRQERADEDGGLEDAGLYIGWLERFLVLTAVVIGSPEAAGLVAAAKSIFRFEDMKQGRAFAEYFLVGTFLSVSEALAAGLLLRMALGLH